MQLHGTSPPSPRPPLRRPQAEGFAETLELRPDGATGDAEWAELVAWLRANLAGEGQVRAPASSVHTCYDT